VIENPWTPRPPDASWAGSLKFPLLDAKKIPQKWLKKLAQDIEIAKRTSRQNRKTRGNLTSLLLKVGDWSQKIPALGNRPAWESCCRGRGTGSGDVPRPRRGRCAGTDAAMRRCCYAIEITKFFYLLCAKAFSPPET
jgi:hypothetical protein